MVNDACKTDTFTLVNTNGATSQIYYIGVNTVAPGLVFSAGVRTISQTATYSFNAALRCPMSFEMKIQNADFSWRTLTTAEQAVVSLQVFYNINLNTPIASQTFNERAGFRIWTSDMTLDMQVWTLKLVPTSTRSTVDNSSQEFGPFSYTFKDVCRDLPLIGATLTQNQFNL